MLKLYLIRHGETQWNAEGRIQGHTDIELNERGLEQARRLAARINGEGAFDAVYASPLRRAFRTATLIGDALNLPVIPDARLIERSLGQLEGLTMSEVKEKFPKVHHAWHEGGIRPPIPGEEAREVFVERTRAFLHDVRAKHLQGRVLAITHGGTINMLLMTGLNLDPERPLPFHIDNASLNIMQWGERGARLRLLNDTCHLSALTVPSSGQNPHNADQKINAAEVQ
jgi:probable phosphoglycerate mutase